MSPRAAWRLESIGFTQVHDYVAGKADWGSSGLPLEGTRGSRTRVGAHLRRDVPTCRLDERLSDVRARVRVAGSSTVRPSLELDRAVERMRSQNLTTLPVTTSEGRLFGLLERDTAERALLELNVTSARTLSEGSPP